MNKEMISDKKLVEEMSTLQLSRWLALFEAINIIADNAEDTGKDIDFLHITKSPLNEYIKNTSDIVYRELKGKELDVNSNDR